jgi:hypothetical protein
METLSLSSYGYKGFTIPQKEQGSQNLDHWRLSDFQRMPASLIYWLPSLTSHSIAEAVARLVIPKSTSLSASLRQRIRQLSDLQENWDGEGAQSIKPYILADAIEVLNRLIQQSNDFREPFLAPTFEGFVQIEWHSKTRVLELEAESQGWAVVGTEIGANDERHYSIADCKRGDFGALKMFYDWFLGNELIWPQSSR